MTLQHKPGTTWDDVYRRARKAAPEAFEANRIANLIGGDWKFVGGNPKGSGRETLKS